MNFADVKVSLLPGRVCLLQSLGVGVSGMSLGANWS